MACRSSRFSRSRAFDTQTVETNSFHFDGGLLSQLKQFRDGPVRLVVSEIVVREIFKHLVEKTRAARDAAAAAHKKAVDHGLASQDEAFVSDAVDIRAVARNFVLMHGALWSLALLLAALNGFTKCARSSDIGRSK